MAVESAALGTSSERKTDNAPAHGIMAEDLGGVDEKKLVRKLDLHLIPLVMGLYLFSFLDRSVSSSPYNQRMH